ncbi:hypothetical protein FACS1894158_03860 [Betaproteobacteria bacterium]|nr:hypothetical protein FACS1894158_03860 [Betaproteobacteria bacterium]
MMAQACGIQDDLEKGGLNVFEIADKDDGMAADCHVWINGDPGVRECGIEIRIQ